MPIGHDFSTTLRRIQAQQNWLVKQAPTAMAMFDRDMNYLAASHSWMQYCGGGRVSLAGLNHYDIHPGLTAPWKEIQAHVLAGETFKSDVDGCFLAGGEHRLSVVAYPWFDDSGQVAGIVMLADDIVERRAIEMRLQEQRGRLQDLIARHAEELRRSDLRLKSVLDALPAMIGYWDRDLRNSYANHAFLDWFGTDPAAICGKHMRELLGEELYALNMPYVEAVLRGERQRFERTMRRPDGLGVRHSIADYIPDVRGGEVRGFYVQITDVTALKESEVALQESEERFRILFGEAPIGLALFRHDGPCVMANAELARMVGSSVPALLESNFRELPAWESSPLLEKALRTFDTGAPQDCAFDALTSFGVRAAIECRLMTVQMRGEPRLLLLAQDVTERKLGEAELLARMERQRDALVREVHHRIKNHLQGVISLLFERLRSAPQLEPLLVPAIADIRTIARAYGLQSVGDNAEVFLGQLVELVVRDQVPEMPLVCCMPPGQLRHVVAQPLVVPLALVINELLTNARKHGGSLAGIRAEVSVEFDESDDGLARVVVRNRPARLPSNFDFATGSGLGTGLELVRTLLPRKGVKLSFAQDGDGVVAVLQLAPSS